MIFVYWCAVACGWFWTLLLSQPLFLLSPSGPVIHEPKTRPSLSRAQLTERLLSHHGSLLQAFNHRRVSNRKPVNNCLKEDQPPPYQCSDTEITGCTRNQATPHNNNKKFVIQVKPDIGRVSLDGFPHNSCSWRLMDFPS